MKSADLTVSVLLIAGFFLVFAYNSSDLKPVQGYPVIAKFNAIDGLDAGSDVRLAGVKVGSVTETTIDPEFFQAVITLNLMPNIKLPSDSTASITGDGLLGGKYVELKPGQSGDKIAPGGEIKKTEDVVGIEELLGKAIFLLSEEITN